MAQHKNNQFLVFRKLRANALYINNNGIAPILVPEPPKRCGINQSRPQHIPLPKALQHNDKKIPPSSLCRANSLIRRLCIRPRYIFNTPRGVYVAKDMQTWPYLPQLLQQSCAATAAISMMRRWPMGDENVGVTWDICPVGLFNSITRVLKWLGAMFWCQWTSVYVQCTPLDIYCMRRFV